MLRSHVKFFSNGIIIIYTTASYPDNAWPGYEAVCTTERAWPDLANIAQAIARVAGAVPALP